MGSRFHRSRKPSLGRWRTYTLRGRLVLLPQGAELAASTAGAAGCFRETEPFHPEACEPGEPAGSRMQSSTVSRDTRPPWNKVRQGGRRGRERTRPWRSLSGGAPGLRHRPLPRQRPASSMEKPFARSQGVGTTPIHSQRLPVRNRSGGNANTVPAPVAPRRRMPSPRVTWIPGESTSASPPRNRPEVELPFAGRPLSPGARESPRRVSAEA